MAAQDKKISSLTQWFYDNIVDAANIVVAYSGENYRIAMSAIRQYVLGNRVIGGPGSNDIPTNGGTQTLANKRLDEPSFNNDVPLHWSVTATQMNFLQNLDVNVKQKLGNIDSDIIAIESNVEGLYQTVDALQADKIYSTVIGAPSGDTKIKIEASSMSNDDIDPYSLSISVYEAPGGGVMKLLNLSNIDIVIANNILSSIVIADVVPMNTYRIVIRYRLASGIGVG